MPRFLVVARVGIVLPSDQAEFTIGNVTVGSSPPDSVLDQVSGLRADFQGAPGQVVWSPPETKIQSNAFAWFERVADDHAEVLKRGSDEELVRLRLVLSRALGRVIEIGSPSARDTQSRQRQATASHAVGVRGLTPLDGLLDSDDLGADYLAVAADARCGVAARHLDRARALSAARSYLGEPAADAAILEYAKALEYLANDNRLAKRVENLAEQQEAEVAALLTRLERSRSSKQKASAVTSAADSLKRLNKKFTAQRLGVMADTLALPPGWLANARALFEARSRKAAHPGESLPSVAGRGLLDSKDGWKNSADGVVSEAIVAMSLHFDQ